jgi:hypothetical protein
MIQGLHGMFENQARVERYNISKVLFAYKMTEGSLISPHVIKVMSYIETLDMLGSELKDDLATEVILQSPLASYESFIMNFHMNGMEKFMIELHGMLKIVEESIKKNPNHVMMIQKEKKNRKCWTSPKGKGKEKVSDEPSSSKPKTKRKSGPSPNEEYFHCHKKGHWFRNYKKYLEEKKKGSETFTSGINDIEINIAVSSSDSWVFDTRSMIHTCKTLQWLSQTRRFAKGELDVHVGNGAKVVAIAVGTYHMTLPSELVLKLNNCYCIPALCNNTISSSCLKEADGFEIIIKNKCCSIYYNGIFHAHCLLVNGLYVLDLENKSVCNINMKQALLNDLNPTFIWHYRLAHINKKNIERLHKDDLLNSFDFESFNMCKSCLLEKMTKAPFTSQSERLSDLYILMYVDQ